MATRVVLNDSAFLELNLPSGLVGRAAAKGAGKLRDDAKRIITQEGRVDTGAMRQGIHSFALSASPVHSSHRVSGSMPYDIYQHEGVKGPIRPRRAKALRFKAGGVYIFRMSTKGFSGIHFLTRAAARLKVSDFT